MNDEQRVSDALAAIQAAADADAVEAIRIEALGKQGWISQALKSLGAMPPEERAKAAPAIQAMAARRHPHASTTALAMRVSMKVERRRAERALYLPLKRGGRPLPYPSPACGQGCRIWRVAAAIIVPSPRLRGEGRKAVQQAPIG